MMNLNSLSFVTIDLTKMSDKDIFELLSGLDNDPVQKDLFNCAEAFRTIRDLFMELGFNNVNLNSDGEEIIESLFSKLSEEIGSSQRPISNLLDRFFNCLENHIKALGLGFNAEYNVTKASIAIAHIAMNIKCGTSWEEDVKDLLEAFDELGKMDF